MRASENSRRRLYGFILFNVIEEVIIAIIAFIILFVFLPTLLVPGMIIVAIGLFLFTLVKIYSYWSSATIPVYDFMIGQEGKAITTFDKEGDFWEGKVVVRGENWKAQASEIIVQDARIWVHGIIGLTLMVGTQPEKPPETKD